MSIINETIPTLLPETRNLSRIECEAHLTVVLGKKYDYLFSLVGTRHSNTFWLLL